MFRNLWLLLLPLLLLAGCASTPSKVVLNSHKVPAYAKKLDRVLISISIVESNINAQEVASRFINKLAIRGLTMTTVISTPKPLELDRGKELRTAIANFQPNQIINLNISMARKQSSTTWVMFEGEIYDVATNKQVWRTLYQGSLETNTFVDAVVQKLDEDGLLPP